MAIPLGYTYVRLRVYCCFQPSAKRPERQVGSLFRMEG